MKLEFDRKTDSAYLEISAGEIVRTQQLEPGVIIDYDAEGSVVGIEILSISKRGTEPLSKAA